MIFRYSYDDVNIIFSVLVFMLGRPVEDWTSFFYQALNPGFVSVIT